MDLKNLTEDQIYGKIPQGIIDQDAQAVVSAVMGAYQDRLEDLRALASQAGNIIDPDNLIGTATPVIEVTYIGDAGVQIKRNVNVTAQTPSDNSLLADWVESEVGISKERQIAQVRTVDSMRQAEVQTLGYLADTLGASLRTDPSLSGSDLIAAQRQILKTYFARLKLKGTGRSFDLLGRLQGFDDVVFSPLWSRVSPRNPGNVGAAENDADFSTYPEINPTATLPDPIYDPQSLNDGDIYRWASVNLSLNPETTNYALAGINGRNPYVKIYLNSENPTVPKSGLFFLAGGSELDYASTGQLLNANNQASGWEIRAIGLGRSFNGAQVQIIADTTTFQIVVTHNLSTIKYRSSYFNLFFTVKESEYASRHNRRVFSNADLTRDPNLCPDGTALSPYRPWKGGATSMPTVVTWPSFTKINGSVITARAQAQITDTETFLEPLQEMTRVAIAGVSEVKPATRYPRLVGSGFLVDDSVGYAPYPTNRRVAILSGGNGPGNGPQQAWFYNGIGYTYQQAWFYNQITSAIAAGHTGNIYTGIMLGAGLQYPLPTYHGTFVFRDSLGNETVLTAEKVPGFPSQLRLKSPQIVAGSYDFATNSYMFETADGVTGEILGIWAPKDSEVIRPEPTNGDIAYSTAPEDDLEIAAYETNDDYPWMRDIIAGGEAMHRDFIWDERISESAVDLPVAVDHLGARKKIWVVDFNRNYRPRYLLEETTSLGQVWVGQRGTDRLSLGLIGNTAVANLALNWTPQRRQGLQAWLRCGEHPSEPYLPTDLSEQALSRQDFESGVFRANYALTDRVWDPTRGWVLQFNQTYLQIDKHRSIQDNATLAFWFKLVQASSSETSIFQYGPIEFKLDGANLRLYLGGVLEHTKSVALNQFLCHAITLRPLSLAEDYHIKLIVKKPIVLTGEQKIDQTNLAVGDLVLVAGQADARSNGIYVVNFGAWHLLTDWLVTGRVWSDGRTRAQLVTENPIIGTTDMLFKDVSHQWNWQVSALNGSWSTTPSGLRSAQSHFTLDDLSLRVQASQSAIFQLSDLQLWNKVLDEPTLDLLKTPALAPTVAQYPLVGAENTLRSSRYLFEVLASGYAFPSNQVHDYRTELLTRAVWYQGNGEFSGDIRRFQTGLGDGTLAEAQYDLGQKKLIDLNGAGRFIASTKVSVTAENNAAWLNESGSGSYVSNIYNWPGPPTEILVPHDGLDHSTPVPALTMNPTQQTAFLSADDGRVFGFAVNGWTQPPESWWIKTRPNEELKSLSPDVVDKLRYLHSATPGIATFARLDGQLKLAIWNSDPYLYQAASTQAGPPIYLSTSLLYQTAFQTNDPTIVNDQNIWLNQTQEGLDLGCVARSTSGPIVLGGTGTLTAGVYRLILDLSNLADRDADFSGFKLEVGIDSNPATEVTALPTGNSSWIIICGSDQTQKLRTNLKASELQTVLNQLPSIINAGGVTVSAGQSRVGGPYIINWNQTGIHPKLLVQGSLVTVDIATLVEGTPTTNQSVRLTLNRQPVLVDVKVNANTGSNWALNIYWSNDASDSDRALVLHSVTVALRLSAVFRIDYSPIRATPVIWNGVAYSTSLPGGWTGGLTLDGNVEMKHEINIFNNNETGAASKFPVAHLLSGSTSDRRMSIVVE